MTHTLYLLRHAKAEPSSALGDRGRQLANRGREQVRVVREWLDEQDVGPQLILCSTAMRTRQTAELLQLGVRIEYLDSLYDGGDTALFRALEELPEDTGDVLVVGHNPQIAVWSWELCRTEEQRRALGTSHPTSTITRYDVAQPWAAFAGPERRTDLVGRFVP